ncbi:MAG: DUF480 domain-containing protein [Pirellulaceae bacterium]|nr:DUF480 domain-containing protein [Pirellulaceae bacterium]
MDHTPAAPSPPVTQRRWQSLSSIDRRVVGVLAEKAKTTPDIYPMSLNAIRTACNQKSNRMPLMELEADEIEESLDRLRELGAVGLVEGYGRVQKYRHYLYDWLGVDKVELAVMTELLLRGDQTVGELRARAARMEPIADLAALRPVVDSLIEKELVVSLTPEGRGQVVTHSLYKPREIESLREKYQRGAPAAAMAARPDPGEAAGDVPPARSAVRSGTGELLGEFAEISKQIDQIRLELQELRNLHNQTTDELHALKESLGG